MTAVPASPQPPAFSPKVMLGLIAVCLVCFAAFSVLSANAPDGRDSPSGGMGATSKAATGFSGAASLLRARGVRVWTGPPPARGYPPGTLVVLTPSLDGPKPALNGYGDRVRIMVVLPKWRTNPEGPNRVSKQGLLDADEIASLLDGLGQTVTVRREVEGKPAGNRADDQFKTAADRPQFIAGQGIEPILTEDDGSIVAGLVGTTIVLADPDMLNNHGLSHLENARAGMSVIDQGHAPGAGVAFPNGTAGAGLGPLSALLKPPLLGATLCALAAILLMGLQALTRFGPAAGSGRAFALGARGLVDNSAALVRMARKEHLLAPAYAALIEAAVAKSAGAERLAGEERLQRLERLAKRRGAGASINELAAAAAAARNRAELLAVARRLHEWKREMTRESR